jgi:SAM-dependent methyltransferase
VEDATGRLQQDWETFARDDPLWAVLTHPDKRGGRWTAQEFFATGRTQIDSDLDALTRVVPGLARGTALDFGCGVGRLTQALATHFDSVVGVDISPTMVAEARELNQHGERCTYLVNARPDLALIESASVDLVYSHIVLQHVPTVMARSYVREFARVLRPGGAAMFTMPSHPGPTWKGRVYRVTPWPLVHAVLRRRHGALMQMNAIRRSEMEALLTSVGLSVRDVAPVPEASVHWRTYRYLAVRA